MMGATDESGQAIERVFGPVAMSRIRPSVDETDVREEAFWHAEMIERIESPRTALDEILAPGLRINLNGSTKKHQKSAIHVESGNYCGCDLLPICTSDTIEISRCKAGRY